jgi:Flp pilus assembly protein TadD
LKLSPGRPTPLSKKLKMGAVQQYIETTDFTQATTTDSYISLCKRAEQYRLQTHFAEAIETLNSAISLRPNKAQAWALRGATLRMLDRFDDALVDLNTAIGLKPNDDFALRNRGDVYRRMNQ